MPFQRLWSNRWASRGNTVPPLWILWESLTMGYLERFSETKLKPDWVAFVFQLLCGWAWFCLCSVRRESKHKKPRLGGNTQRVGNLWWCVSLSTVVSLGAHVLPCIPFATILSTPFAWTMTAAPHLSPISALAILYPHAASYIGVRAIFSEHKSVCVTLLVKPIKASHCFFFFN